MNRTEVRTPTYDLHLHSYWSYDAVAPVEYYFRRARQLGIRCIAVTEHHSMDSLPEISTVAKGYPEVRWIPAAELTVTTASGRSIDMVCLGLPLTPPPELRRVLACYHEWQRAYGAAVSAGLQALGHDFSDQRRLELLRTYRPQKVIDVQGNTHVQNGVQRRYFVQQEFIPDETHYSALLTQAAERVPRPSYPLASEVIPAVQRAGGLAIIAHPTGYFEHDNRQCMDARREELGFDGIECAHPTVTPELTSVYRAYCREHGLLSTAGSDCHADPDDNPHHIGERNVFGCHCGPDEWLDEVRERLPAL